MRTFILGVFGIAATLLGVAACSGRMGIDAGGTDVVVSVDGSSPDSNAVDVINIDAPDLGVPDMGVDTGPAVCPTMCTSDSECAAGCGAPDAGTWCCTSGMCNVRATCPAIEDGGPTNPACDGVCGTADDCWAHCGTPPGGLTTWCCSAGRGLAGSCAGSASTVCAVTGTDSGVADTGTDTGTVPTCCSASMPCPGGLTCCPPHVGTCSYCTSTGCGF